MQVNLYKSDLAIHKTLIYYAMVVKKEFTKDKIKRKKTEGQKQEKKYEGNKNTLTYESRNTAHTCLSL